VPYTESTPAARARTVVAGSVMVAVMNCAVIIFLGTKAVDADEPSVSAQRTV
jgi:hypothetical protein